MVCPCLTLFNALPAGLSLNASTGAVTGTPTAAYSTANLVISVRDANSVVASTASTVSFSVIDATATTMAQNLNVTKTMATFTPLTASGGTPPYIYSITTGTLPSGLSLNISTGAVAGTPTATYTTANIVFSVHDANNTVAGTTSTVSFTVLPAGYVVQGGLIWMPATFSDSWTNANAYCTNAYINGQIGWRLPTLAELTALRASGAMNGQGWTLSATWTSTYQSGQPCGFNLNDGGTGCGAGYSFYVTCVR